MKSFKQIFMGLPNYITAHTHPTPTTPPHCVLAAAEWASSLDEDTTWVLAPTITLGARQSCDQVAGEAEIGSHWWVLWMDVLMQNKPNLRALRYLIIFTSQTHLYVERSLRRNKCKFELLLYSSSWSGSHYNIHMWITTTTSSPTSPRPICRTKNKRHASVSVFKNTLILTRNHVWCSSVQSNSWISPLHGLVITACNSFWLDFKFTNSFTGFPLSLYSTEQ